jgi:hypothetical protein
MWGLTDEPNVVEECAASTFRVKVMGVRMQSGYVGRLQGGQSGPLWPWTGLFLLHGFHISCLPFCFLFCSCESDWLFLEPCVCSVTASPPYSLWLCRRRQHVALKVWFPPVVLQSDNLGPSYKVFAMVSIELHWSSAYTSSVHWQLCHCSTTLMCMRICQNSLYHGRMTY